MATELLPNKEKRIYKTNSKDPRVPQARDSVKKAFAKFQQNTTNINQKELQQQKGHLHKVCDTITDED